MGARIREPAARPSARIAKGLAVASAWALPMLPAVRINLDAAAGQGTAWTTFAIASIAFAAVCVEICVTSAESRHYGRIALYGSLGLLFTGLNVLNAIGNAATHSDHSRDDRSSQIERKQRLARMREQWSQGRKAQFDIAGDATPDAIEGEVQAAKAADAKRWNATEGCDIAKVSAGPTRTFCEAIHKLAAAKKREELDARIAEIDRDDGGTAPASVDPFADNIAHFIGMLGYAVDTNGKVLISVSRDWGKAVGVELLAAFGPAALLLLFARKPERPTLPAALPKAAAKKQQPAISEKSKREASPLETIAPVSGDDPDMLAFIARRLERCDGVSMKAGDLFKLWEEDCSETGISAGSQKAFSPRIRKFFEHDPNNGRPRYRNVQRKSAQPAIRMVVSN